MSISHVLSRRPGSPPPTVELLDTAAATDKSGVDFGLHTTPAVRVSGRVEDSTGRCRHGAPPDARGLEELGVGSESATATVGTDGRFALLGVAAGTYTLLAPGSSFEFSLRPQGGLGAREPSLPGTPGLRQRRCRRGGLGTPSIGFNTRVPLDAAAHAGSARMAVTVGVADVANLVVPLEATATLHAQVTDDTGAAVQTGTISLEAANASPALGTSKISASTRSGVSLCSGSAPRRLRLVRVPNWTIQSSAVIGGEDYLRRPHLGGWRCRRHGRGRLGEQACEALRGGPRRQELPVPLAAAIAFPVDQTLWTNYGFVPTWIRPSVGTSNGSYRVGV